MKKLLYLFSAFLIFIASAFTTLDNTVKDGTYKAFISKSTSIDVNGFSGENSFEQVVEVRITDNTVKNISQIRYNKNNDKLLDLPLRIDSNGNAVTETSFFEQNIYNKNDLGHVYKYKLIIKKEELAK